MVSSIRIELEETALVRPSNEACWRGVGSAGSTTIAESPLESSADARVRPTSPPANWLGSVGAYSSDLLLLVFGLGSVLFIPVILVSGLRLLRLEPAGPIARGLLIASLSAVLIGVALGLTSGSAVSGLPAGWG